AVLGARAWFRLPYFFAAGEGESRAGWIRFSSRCDHPGVSVARFSPRYRAGERRRLPGGGRRTRRLVERYCRYRGAARSLLPAEETGVVGRGKDDGRRDVIRHAEPSPGNHARETVREFRTLLRELLAEQRRVGRARTHAVDVDTMARDLAGDSLGERDEPALRRGVHSLAGGADASGVGGDGHDLAVLRPDHVAQRRARAGERPAQIDGENPVPEFRRRLDERHRPIPTRAVDEHVEA